jgi:hypothetical protein
MKPGTRVTDAVGLLPCMAASRATSPLTPLLAPLSRDVLPLPGVGSEWGSMELT